MGGGRGAVSPYEEIELRALQDLKLKMDQLQISINLLISNAEEKRGVGEGLGVGAGSGPSKKPSGGLHARGLQQGKGKNVYSGPGPSRSPRMDGLVGERPNSQGLGSRPISNFRID